MDDIPYITVEPPVNVSAIPEDEWQLHCDGQELESDYVDDE